MERQTQDLPTWLLAFISPTRVLFERFKRINIQRWSASFFVLNSVFLFLLPLIHQHWSFWHGLVFLVWLLPLSRTVEIVYAFYNDTFDQLRRVPLKTKLDRVQRFKLLGRSYVEVSICYASLYLAVPWCHFNRAPSTGFAIPLVACPELLCMDRVRPTHDNMQIPDFFGLKALQQELVGPATLDSLKARNSRRISLYDVLCRLTFGPIETVEKVRALLMRAAARLGAPNEKSDLGDPRLMVVHALNVLDRENWKEVMVRDSGGQEKTVLQYQSPEAEVKQLEPIQKEASPRLEESNQQFGILNALYASEAPTLDFLEKATGWAQEHTSVFENRPEFDGDGKHLASVEAVVSAATLLARYGTPAQLLEHGAWMREIFARVHQGDSDPVYAAVVARSRARLCGMDSSGQWLWAGERCTVRRPA